MRFVLLLLALHSSWGLAYPKDHTVGFGLGYTWSQVVFNDQIRTLGNTQETPSYSSVNNSQLPWRMHYTTMYTQYYGIEFGMVNFGGIKFQKNLTTVDMSTNTTTSISLRNANITSQGFTLQHILNFPMSKELGAFVKIGIIIGDTEFSETETLTVFSEDVGDSTVVQSNQSTENFTNWHYSLGGSYSIADSWAISLQLNQIEIDHKAENETFTRWFTHCSFEYRF